MLKKDIAGTIVKQFKGCERPLIPATESLKNDELFFSRWKNTAFYFAQYHYPFIKNRQIWEDAVIISFYDMRSKIITQIKDKNITNLESYIVKWIKNTIQFQMRSVMLKDRLIKRNKDNGIDFFTYVPFEDWQKGEYNDPIANRIDIKEAVKMLKEYNRPELHKIIELYAKGDSCPEIGKKVGLRKQTIQYHIKKIFSNIPIEKFHNEEKIYAY